MSDETYYRDEPDCYDCSDRGALSLLDLELAGKALFTRERPGRRRCVECNPSPRQDRRFPLRMRRLDQEWDRDVRLGRVFPFGSGAEPF